MNKIKKIITPVARKKITQLARRFGLRFVDYIPYFKIEEENVKKFVSELCQ